MRRCSLLAPLVAARRQLGLWHASKRYGSTRHKVMTADDAVHLIRDGDTVTISGFVAQNGPEEILIALEKRFKETNHPRDLTILFGAGPANFADKGLSHVAHEGLVKRLIGAHYGGYPPIAELAQSGKVEAYSLPLGSISRMIRAAASKSPGHLTSVGFGTMVDPKFGGGKINKKTKEDLVQELEINGQKYLLYKAVPVDVALIRGTTADLNGNITMERESLYGDNLIQAMAARANGGIAIAQVEHVAINDSLNSRNVRIPGTLVDGVVVANHANHTMSYFTDYNPAHAGAVRTPSMLGSLDMDERKIVARRALLEVVPNQVVNLGIGMAEGVALVAEEEKVLNFITLTTEPGVHGGVGASGYEFGPAKNYDALLEMNQQFDFYNGGGLDVCFLGMLHVSRNGDVNVTRAGPMLKGPGGFIDIAQTTKRVNLLGTLTAGGLEVAVRDGKVVIVREGKSKKFVDSLPEICFSGQQAVARKQLVHYITERCVFKLTPEGLELIEVAPGIDVQTQIVDQMGFKPIIKKVRPMNPKIFRPERMGLLESLYSLDMKARMHFSERSGTLYLDFHGISVTSVEKINEIRRSIEGFFHARPEQVGRANVFVNYDGFDCSQELTGLWEDHAKELQDRLYGPVRRVSSRGFARHKLADSIHVALESRYTFEEAYHLLRSIGVRVSPEACLGLCVQRERRDAPGSVTSDDIRSIIDELRH